VDGILRVVSYARTLAGLGQQEAIWQTDAQRRTHELLLSCAEVFAAQCRATPIKPRDPHRTPQLLYGRGLGADEAAGFDRARRHGLITIAADGNFQVPGARACSPNLHLVGRNEDHVCLHTEVLIHITAYAELVLDQGWTPDRLIFDPFFKKASLDLWGYRDPPTTPVPWEGTVTFAAEAKARVEGGDGLKSLLSALDKLSDDPGTPVDDGHRRKWTELVTLTAERSIDLLLVADGARWWFSCTGDGGTVHIKQSSGPSESWRFP
jgi:hypothetical protein